jgi:hypothetical protein
MKKSQPQPNQIEAILDKKIEGRKQLYLVRWKGTTQPSWEYKGNIPQELVDSYEAGLQKASDNYKDADVIMTSPRKAKRTDSSLMSDLRLDSVKKAKQPESSANK